MLLPVRCPGCGALGGAGPGGNVPRVSTTEQPTEATFHPGATSRIGAGLVVLLLVVVAGLLILTFAFKTSNADYSIDGKTATTSSYTGDDQAPSQ